MKVAIQYFAKLKVVEQRRRSGLDRPTAIAVPIVESPVVDRKIKPGKLNQPFLEVFNANTYFSFWE